MEQSAYTTTLSFRFKSSEQLKVNWTGAHITGYINCTGNYANNVVTMTPTEPLQPFGFNISGYGNYDSCNGTLSLVNRKSSDIFYSLQMEQSLYVTRLYPKFSSAKRIAVNWTGSHVESYQNCTGSYSDNVVIMTPTDATQPFGFTIWGAGNYDSCNGTLSDLTT